MSQHNPQSADPSSQRTDMGIGYRPLELELAATLRQLVAQLVVATVAGNAVVRQTILELLAENDAFMGRLMMNYRQQIEEMVAVAVAKALAEQPPVVCRTERVQTRFPISPLDLTIGMFLGLIAGLEWLNTSRPLHLGVLYELMVFMALMLGISAIAGVIGASLRQHTVELPSEETATEKEAQQ